VNETKGEEARWRVSQAQGTNQPGGAKKTKREKGEKTGANQSGKNKKARRRNGKGANKP